MKTKAEIDKVHGDVIQTLTEGGGHSKFPAMTYEEGVKYTLEWVLELTDTHPLED